MKKPYQSTGGAKQGGKHKRGSHQDVIYNRDPGGMQIRGFRPGRAVRSIRVKMGEGHVARSKMGGLPSSSGKGKRKMYEKKDREGGKSGGIFTSGSRAPFQS